VSDHGDDNDERFSVEGARAAAERDELAAWVRDFLASPGSDNPVLAEVLSDRMAWWTGPVELPLSRLERLAGPPDEPVLVPVDEEYWDERVDDMARRITEEGWEPSPVVVSFQDGGRLEVEDGNHRLESLRRAGRDEAWSVVGFEDESDLDRFEVPPA
jgi:hypothetical protein